MDKVIVVTLAYRPEYTRLLIKALEECRGIEQYKVYFHIEPVSKEVIQIAQEAKLDKEIEINKGIKGCTRNHLDAFSKGFYYTDYVILFEDDTIPSKDALQYFEWCKTHADDPRCGWVSGWNQRAPNSDEYTRVSIRNSMRPWGFAIWKDRWEEALKLWRPKIPHWDMWLWHEALLGRYEVYPRLARVQNIGSKQGSNVPNFDHYIKHMFNPFCSNLIIGTLDELNRPYRRDW